MLFSVIKKIVKKIKNYFSVDREQERFFAIAEAAGQIRLLELVYFSGIVVIVMSIA